MPTSAGGRLRWISPYPKWIRPEPTPVATPPISSKASGASARVLAPTAQMVPKTVAAMEATWPAGRVNTRSTTCGTKPPANNVTVSAADELTYTARHTESGAPERTPTPMPKNIRYTHARMNPKPHTQLLKNVRISCPSRASASSSKVWSPTAPLMRSPHAQFFPRYYCTIGPPMRTKRENQT